MVNSPGFVIGRDIAPEVGQFVYEIIGGTGTNPQDDGELRLGFVVGKVTKVIGRLASNTHSSPTLSCGVEWIGSDEGMQMKKTGLGGMYDLVLSSKDPTHPDYRKPGQTPTVVVQKTEAVANDFFAEAENILEQQRKMSAIEQPETPKKEKESGFEFGSPDKSPSKWASLKSSGPAPLWRPGSFKLKNTARPCTEIDEFKNLTKSMKEKEIEAKLEATRELRQLSREASASGAGAGAGLLGSDAKPSLQRLTSSGSLQPSPARLLRADSSSLKGSLRGAAGSSGSLLARQHSRGSVKSDTAGAGSVRRRGSGLGRALVASDSKNNVQAPASAEAKRTPRQTPPGDSRHTHS